MCLIRVCICAGFGFWSEVAKTDGQRAPQELSSVVVPPKLPGTKTDLCLDKRLERKGDDTHTQALVRPFLFVGCPTFPVPLFFFFLQI